MRFLGKRQIGEMQISELVTTFLLSDIAAQPLTNTSIPIVYAILPVITLVCLEVFFSFLPTKIGFLKKMLDSPPSIIIKHGKIDRREMVRMRMSLEDLLCELHLAGYTSPTEIDYAILESNGKLAFFPIYAEKPRAKGDFSAGKPLPEQSLAHPLIIDGKIMKYAMKNAQKSEEWLFSKLKKSNIKEIGEVFLMTVDDTDKTEIITKKECKP
jgi:uncharacterized membrane protein YcaP (DUF421 family)